MNWLLNCILLCVIGFVLVWMWVKWFLFVVLLIVVVIVVWFVQIEIEMFWLQVYYLFEFICDVGYMVEVGLSDYICFLVNGLYDQCFGYVMIFVFQQWLFVCGFVVSEQVCDLQWMLLFGECGLFFFYEEKDQMGLMLFDLIGLLLFVIVFLQCVYVDFDMVLCVIIDLLLFIEDCYLFDVNELNCNLVIDWGCFSCVFVDQVLYVVNCYQVCLGGSMFVMQIEKFCYLFEGCIVMLFEKLWQIVFVLVCVYLNGLQMMFVCCMIVVCYLNLVLFVVWLYVGEIIGIGDGFVVWYGCDFNDVNCVLFVLMIGDNVDQQGKMFCEVLLLLIVQCVLLYFLNCGYLVLQKLIDSYLWLLLNGGVILFVLCDVVFVVQIECSVLLVVVCVQLFVLCKVVMFVCVLLLLVFGISDLYQFDQFDFQVISMFDNGVQQVVVVWFV